MGAKETFAERVKRLRESRGLSRADVASRVGRSEQWVREIESGKTQDPGLSVGIRLARLFRVSPDHLAFGTLTAVERAGAELDGDVSSPDDRLAKLEDQARMLPELAAQSEENAALLRSLVAGLASAGIEIPERSLVKKATRGGRGGAV